MESQKKPLILDIKGNSLDDGPGIRTVVFFKGCPLSCRWCHNPESKETGMDISFDKNACIGCNHCLSLCPHGALDKKVFGFIDRQRCDLCLKCVEQCPAEALTQVGKEMTVEDVVAAVKKDMPFFKNSGGGVTLSGGEPTYFMDYCSELIRACKELGVHTLLETCGSFNYQSFLELIYPFVDCIYYDIKIMDEEEHKRLCGASNRLILENFSRLQEICTREGKMLLPRIPLIPEMTATEDNLRSIASFLRQNGVGKVALLPYHPLWIEKNEKIGKTLSFEQKYSMSSWMKPSEVTLYRSFLEGMEIV